MCVIERKEIQKIFFFHKFKMISLDIVEFFTFMKSLETVSPSQ